MEGNEASGEEARDALIAWAGAGRYGVGRNSKDGLRITERVIQHTT